MRANTPTLLSLYDFARILEINPLHFAGIDLTSMNLSHPFCNQPWVQYAWQAGDRTSREAVGRAISTAEAKIAEYLGFDPLPRFHVNERADTTQPADPTLINLGGRSLRGWGSEVRLRRGYAISGGCRKTTAIDIVPQEVEVNGSPVEVNVFWEADGIWEKGEIYADVVAGTDPCSVHVYYPGKGPNPAWEIRPIIVDVVGTQAFITVRRECCVSPALWESLDPRAAAGGNDADFLDDFDIFVETIDPSCSVVFNWMPIGRCNTCGNTGGTCPSCQVGTQNGCIVISESKLGYASFTPATWDAETDAFTLTSYSLPRQPETVQLSYYAGYLDDDPSNPCPRRQMNEELAQAIAYYASALLERPICACNVDAWKYWREDPSDTSTGRFTNTVYSDSPFGSRRGAIFAWQMVLKRSLGRSPIMQ